MGGRTAVACHSTHVRGARRAVPTTPGVIEQLRALSAAEAVLVDATLLVRRAAAAALLVRVEHSTIWSSHAALRWRRFAC